MNQIVLREPGSFERQETAAPQPATGEALVRVRRVGVCGTDLHAFAGRQPFFSYPRILGHELGVEVLEVPDGSAGVQPGDRCAVNPYSNCETCGPCRRGRTNCCESLRVLGVHSDGGMRELFTVPVSKLHPSRTLRLEQLALVETLGIGAHAVERSGMTETDTVLVVGLGPIGLSVVQFANVTNARVLTLEMVASRRAFCSEHLRVEHSLVPSDTTEQDLRDLLDGDLPTIVLDATGSPASMRSSFEYVASSGKLVFVGLFQGDYTFTDPEFHRRELTLLATRNSRPSDFDRIIRLMESGDVDTSPWVTHEATFDDFVESFPAWTEPGSGVVKAMLSL